MTTPAPLDLPVGCSARRPDVGADISTVLELTQACDLAAIGRPNTTADTIADWLVAPGLDLRADSWLVEDSAGRVVGWTWVLGKGSTNTADVEVYVRPGADALWEPLLGEVTRRAAELAAGHGHGEAILDIWVHRSDAAKSGAVRAAGWAVATTFLRMHVGLTGPPVGVAAPGIVVRKVAGRHAEDDLRTAHRISTTAMAGHFGLVAKPYERWLEIRDGRSDIDWSQLWIADVDGQPAGMLLGTDHYAATDDAGFVLTLAVLEEARRRGAAKALLAEHFAESWRRGRTAVILYVDGSNSTGAVRLYESVGMRPVLHIDDWRCTVPARPS